DRLASRGAAIADAAERYFSVAAAAEAAGQNDRALTLYSRSYGRDSSYRPTLERLSAICFERGQWDNAWKATEALLERHGGALAMAEGRWSDALATLEALSADDAFNDERRSDFLIAAGDILVQHYGDTMAARALFDRARVLWPGNPSLWHVAESSEV